MDVIDQKEQRIVPIHLEKEMQRSFIEYAMSVIVDRALPDVRDGLKPVHRRILYAMDTLGLRPDKQYRKSATVVGECLGHYHPHGDSSVYDAMVRLAQDFNTRYPLVDGHGNFGSVDGDGAAAMRYTEAKLSRIATDMLADIDKETVDFGPNFDESTTEPKVLPSRFPNILVNGSNGIAVGMATNIPPHNLGETIDGLVALIDDPEITSESLMQYIPGPDFPTRGIIMGRAGIAQAYRTGRGRILVRGRAEIEPMPRDKSRIVITEIPYQVNKAKLVERIAELHKEKKVEGITDLRDESSRDGMRIVVELKAGVNANVVLNQLYKHTDLQTTFGIINLALTPEPGGNGLIPKVMSLREILAHYLDHQKSVVSRRTAFELERARKRLEIIVGLLIAIDNVDEIVRLIKTSADPAEAKVRLMDRFGLTELQAQSILDMRLQRLTGLEKDKLLAEQKELRDKIAWCEGILSSEEKLLQLIKQEALEVKARYGDPRRTQIEQVTDDIDLGDIIQEEDMCVTMSHMGYIKRITPDAYASQRRGGTGKRGQKVREDDFIEHLFVTSTHSSMLYFTNKGRVFRNKCYSIPEAGSAAKGTSIVNLLQLGEGEKVTAILPILPDQSEGYILMATKLGLIKKTELSKFDNIRKTGLIALDLRGEDELITAELSSGSDEFIIASRNGRCFRFSETEVRSMGRTAAGMRSMRLREDDCVVDMVKVVPGGEIVTVSDQGKGKRTPVEQYALKGRGAQGYSAMELRDENKEELAAHLCGLKMYTGDSDLMMMRDDGMMIRFDLAAVASSGRGTRGVILMKVPEGTRIAAVSLVPHQEPDPSDAEESPDAEESGAGAADSTGEGNAENAGARPGDA